MLYATAIFSGLMVLAGLSVIADKMHKPHPDIAADLFVLAFFLTVTLLSFWGARTMARRRSQRGVNGKSNVIEQPTPGLLSRISKNLEQARERREAEAEGRRRKLAEQELLRREELDRVRSGTLEPVHDCVSILQKGETAFFTISASLAEMKTVGYRGRSSGVSLRVAKGITVRTGGFGGHAVKELVRTATGQLAVTNRRLLFAGDAKSRATKLDKIVSIERFTDGIGIHEDNKSVMYLVAPGHRRDLLEAIIRRMASEV